MSRHAALILWLLAGAWLAGCDVLSPSEPEDVVSCGGYGDWKTSPYLLPFAVGESYYVSRGACDQNHRGVNRYGHDFDLPVGTPVTAARAGVVSRVESAAGFLVVDHGDGSWGSYFHLQAGQILVTVGQQVATGQPLAPSGATGTTHPHLHFHIKPCGDEQCDSMAVNYRNTDPNPLGVRSGRFYPAR